MPETPETRGGEVEHEVYMVEGIILLVIELKLEFKKEKDFIAQVLLELACESCPFYYLVQLWTLKIAAAHKLNRDKNFDPQPPVYAVLTDMRIFYFFRYDGSEFTLMRVIYVSDQTRSEFLRGMMEGITVLPHRCRLV
jgi:hypothetical protein